MKMVKKIMMILKDEIQCRIIYPSWHELTQINKDGKEDNDDIGR